MDVLMDHVKVPMEKRLFGMKVRGVDLSPSLDARELPPIPPLPAVRGDRFFDLELSAERLNAMTLLDKPVQDALSAAAETFAAKNDSAWEQYFLLIPPLEDALKRGFDLPFALYPYQAEGVSFLANRRRALLADDMGLGKTIQAITAARFLLNSGLIRSILAVCPAGLKSNWKAEFERWAPEASAVVVAGDAKKRAKQWSGPYHVWIAGYETTRNDMERMSQRGFDLVILDEAQRIKNAETRVAKAVKALPRRASWCLTGTPIENSVSDLGSIGQFLDPQLSIGEAAEPEEARKIMAPYYLRRHKSAALKNLPEKHVRTARLDLTPAQRKAYDAAESKGETRLQHMGDSVTLQHVLALITRLKQICNYDPLTEKSVKLNYLRDALKEIAERGEKALIFSQYRKTLDFIEARLEEFNPVPYHGGLWPSQKEAAVARFKEDSDAKAMLISLQAGGVGLNLQEASYVFHYDRWWNPAVERQAEDRAYRLGQRRDVIVTRLVAADTIEEKIDAILKEKEELFDRFVDEGVESGQGRLSESDYFQLVGLEQALAPAAAV